MAFRFIAACGLPGHGSHAARPCIGFGDNIEEGRGVTVANLQGFDLNSEEAEVVYGVGVEPVDGGAVIVLEPFSDPNHGGLPGTGWLQS